MEWADIEQETDRIDAYLRQHINSFKRKNNGSYTWEGLCPFHVDSHLGNFFGFDSGGYHCFSSKCGSTGNFWDLFCHIENLDSTDKKTVMEKLMEELGMAEMRHVYDSGDVKSREVDETGKTVRLPDSNKRKIKWDGGRKYPPELYRKNKIMAASHVIFSEGEKCVEFLEGWGYVATTLPESSLKENLTEILEPLKGKHVLLLPDGGAEEIMNKIGRAGQFKITKWLLLDNLGDNEDIEDWAKRPGNTKEKFASLMKSAPLWYDPSIEIDMEQSLPDEKDDSLPSELRDGIFGEYIERSRDTTESSDVTHYLALLSAAGLIVGRDIWCEYGMRLYPNLYLVYFGPTGDNKTTGLSRATEFINPAFVTRGEESPQALLDWMLSLQSPVLLYKSEFSTLHKMAGWNASTLTSLLITLYDCPPVYDVRYRTKTGKNESVTLINPTVNVLAATTDEELWTNLKNSEISSGFLNRFAFFTGKAKDFIPWPVNAEPILNQFKSKLKPGSSGEMRLDEKADAIWREWYVEYRKKLDEEGDDTRNLCRRSHALAIKTAMLWAYYHQRTTIDSWALLKGIVTAEYNIYCTKQLLATKKLSINPMIRCVEMEAKLLQTCKEPHSFNELWRKKCKSGLSRDELRRKIASLIKGGDLTLAGKNRSGLDLYKTRLDT